MRPAGPGGLRASSAVPVASPEKWRGGNIHQFRRRAKPLAALTLML